RHPHAGGRRSARRAGLPVVFAAPVGRDLRLRRAVGRRRGAQSAQHRTGGHQDVHRGRRAPRRRPRHQDAAAGIGGRSGQRTVAALMARSPEGPLKGKVAFITGAARGQGRAHAVRLAADGADIIAVDLCDQIASVPYSLATPEDLAATVKLVEDTGARIVAARGDVRDRESLAAGLQAGLDEFGRLDIVVANAGIAPMQSGDDGWHDVIDVNLTGVYNTIKAAIPAMVKQGTGGSIVLISSA